MSDDVYILLMMLAMFAGGYCFGRAHAIVIAKKEPTP